MSPPRRTIVGSHPHRRTLPMGREAIERALRLCRAWPRSAVAGSDNAQGAATRADYARNADLRNGSLGPEWLPDEARWASVARLEALPAAEVRP